MADDADHEVMPEHYVEHTHDDEDNDPNAEHGSNTEEEMNVDDNDDSTP